jgi:hypothetical protein
MPVPSKSFSVLTATLLAEVGFASKSGAAARRCLPLVAVGVPSAGVLSFRPNFKATPDLSLSC